MNTRSPVLNPRHHDRPVVRVEVNGRPVIRKRYRDGSEVVHRSMEALWMSAVGASRTCPGVPEPLGLDPANQAIDMAFIDGTPASTGGTFEGLPAVLDEVAALLADLHDSGVVVARRRDARKVIRLLAARLEPTDADIVHHLERRAPTDEVLCVNHGDFSPRNVILTPNGPVLIDLDRLQMAGAGRDLNHLGAWCWAMAALGRDQSGIDAWTLCDEFEAAYLTHRPSAAADLVRGRRFHRATALLRIATEWSAVVADQSAKRLVMDEARRWASATN